VYKALATLQDARAKIKNEQVQAWLDQQMQDVDSADEARQVTAQAKRKQEQVQAGIDNALDRARAQIKRELADEPKARRLALKRLEDQAKDITTPEQAAALADDVSRLILTSRNEVQPPASKPEVQTRETDNSGQPQVEVTTEAGTQQIAGSDVTRSPEVSAGDLGLTRKQLEDVASPLKLPFYSVYTQIDLSGHGLKAASGRKITKPRLLTREVDTKILWTREGELKRVENSTRIRNHQLDINNASKNEPASWSGGKRGVRLEVVGAAKKSAVLPGKLRWYAIAIGTSNQKVEQGKTDGDDGSGTLWLAPGDYYLLASGQTDWGHDFEIVTKYRVQGTPGR
jgi:hypothetical protein